MIKRKQLFALAAILAWSASLTAQTAPVNESLRTQLWSFVGYSASKPLNEEGEPMEKVSAINEATGAAYMEDAANGYLHVRDGGPPCGCYFDIIAGAFKTADGYVFLRNTYDFCSQSYTCIPSCSWSRILPEGVDVEYFYKKAEDVNPHYSVFYVEVSIPRYGREVTFTTKLTPFGINSGLTGVPFNGNIPFANTSSPYAGTEFGYVKNFDPAGLEKRSSYTAKELDELAAQIFGKMKKSKEGTTLELVDIQNALRYLYGVFVEYKKVDFKTITTEWNSAKARFVIKKVDKLKTYSNFIDFIMSDSYWIATC